MTRRQPLIATLLAIALLTAGCTTSRDPDVEGAGGAEPTTTVRFPAAPGLPDLPAQPDGVPFPTKAWATASANPKVAGEIDGLLDQAFAGPDDPFGRVEAVVVVAGGRIVAERYGRGHTADARHVSWSVAKSVTNALLGILAGDGRLDMFSPAAVTEWADPTDPRHAITPDALARMSSGLEWREVADAVALVGSIDKGPAAAQQATRPLGGTVGGTFNYSTGSTSINGRIIGDLVGTGAEFTAWAHQVLFTPLGIEDVELLLDTSGYFAGGWGANMSARNFARFGLLYLRDGRWDGLRVLPPGWVDFSRSPSATNASYGAGWWLDRYGPGTFAAEGFMGQKVVVDPRHDVVVVVLAGNFDSGPPGRLAAALVSAFDN
ncbi:MAG: serine hydrolase domain-containing protein [Acidimicrobiales bacterium]